MCRSLFLILILFCSTAFAQIQEKRDAYIFDEYRKITTKKLKTKLSKFIMEMLKIRTTTGNLVTGNIIVYAPNERKINLRVEAIRNFLRISDSGGFIDFDTSIITFVSKRNENEKTEFWIVPSDTLSPIPSLN